MINSRKKSRLVLWASAVIWIIPVVWMFSLSLQYNKDLARTTSRVLLGLIPIPFTLENYVHILSRGLVRNWLFNSFVISSMMIFSVLVFATTAGYALSKIKFFGRSIIIPIIIACLTIPEQATIIPLYTIFADWGWYNNVISTFIALIIPRVASPFGVFFMMQFFKSIPHSIEEAASLDGANRWVIFTKIILPISRPAISTLAILTFLYSWNDFLWPLISVSKKEWYTATTGLASIQTNFAQSEGLGSIMASGVVSALPVIILLIVLQKYIIRGITLSSGK